MLSQCLLDPEHTSLMKQAVESLIKAPAKRTGARLQTIWQLAGLRQSLLDHMTSMLIEETVRSGDQSKSSKCVSRNDESVAQLADFGIFLCSSIPRMRKSSRSIAGQVRWTLT